jgi:uncharacterized membrane protein YdbT with pleckstrin-like domain
MSFARRLLNEDEDLVADLHPHWKALILPTLALIVLVGLAVYGVVAVPGSVRPWAQWSIILVATVLIVVLSLLPYTGWRTTHLVITNHRVITRSGILTRTGRDIPLSRVNDVSFTHSLLERMLGCGTLVVESGGERGQLSLADVPRVEWVQRRLSELVEDDLNRRGSGRREPAGSDPAQHDDGESQWDPPTRPMR